MNVNCDGNEIICEAIITITFPSKQTIMKHNMNEFDLIRGGSKNFSKGGFYTIVVTFNANGGKASDGPVPLTRALTGSGAKTKVSDFSL